MQNIAIIGSGPTAIYTARYLILKGEALAITIFESQAEAGKGTPYHQDWNEKEMLSNIASIELPPIIESLVEWLIGRNDEELIKLGIVRENINERTFFPRVALGEYFQAQLKNLIKLASEYGSTLLVKTRHKVLDVMIVESGIKLTVNEYDENIRDSVFDYAVMATGHAWPKETEITPGYFLSPWPSSALKNIKDGNVGIRGTSLSAIDALVTLSLARGAFVRNPEGVMHYQSEPGMDNFHVTMMSRKGLLPEADFYHPIPYTPLKICTKKAVDELIASAPRHELLDAVFDLFKTELINCDPEYAAHISLWDLTLEQFSHAYFYDREQCDPFIWAKANLAEEKANEKRQYTVPWRYAILRMHEIVARTVPHLLAEDHQRFNNYFKHVFVDDYATVPHESIERLLALHEAGKLDIMRVGDDYVLDNVSAQSGAIYKSGDVSIHFPAFIEAMGQRPLSVHEFPFPSLWKQGLLQKAAAPYFAYVPREQRKSYASIGGVALDLDYHPVSGTYHASKLYCLSLPFMLGQFPFAQGITSSHDMGKKVTENIIKQIASPENIISNNKEYQPYVAGTG